MTPVYAGFEGVEIAAPTLQRDPVDRGERANGAEPNFRLLGYERDGNPRELSGEYSALPYRTEHSEACVAEDADATDMEAVGPVGCADFERSRGVVHLRRGERAVARRPRGKRRERR